MAKGNILEDSFEKLVEQGTTQTKKAAKSASQQVKQSANPTKLWEQLLGVSSPADSNEGAKPPRGEVAPAAHLGGEMSMTETGRNKNHTPINLEKLGKSYQDNEKQKTEALRQRLFQLVKLGEEKVLLEKKQEEEEKKRKELYEAQEKKKREEEKKKQQFGELPKGKIRRSIFSPKKIAQRQHSEFKPSSGKQ